MKTKKPLNLEFVKSAKKKEVFKRALLSKEESRFMLENNEHEVLHYNHDSGSIRAKFEDNGILWLSGNKGVYFPTESDYNNSLNVITEKRIFSKQLPPLPTQNIIYTKDNVAIYCTRIQSDPPEYLFDSTTDEELYLKSTAFFERNPSLDKYALSFNIHGKHFVNNMQGSYLAMLDKYIPAFVPKADLSVRSLVKLTDDYVEASKYIDTVPAELFLGIYYYFGEIQKRLLRGKWELQPYSGAIGVEPFIISKNQRQYRFGTLLFEESLNPFNTLFTPFEYLLTTKIN